MKTSDRGLNLIKKFEGFSPVTYICVAGFRTIGYGHAIKKGEKWDNSGVITEGEASELLAQDIGIAERAVQRLIYVPLNQEMFDSLVSWTFNLGGGALQRSTMRSVLNRQEYRSVPNEMRKWVYGGGKPQKGLIRRREEEARLFQEGILYGV
jgi:lysozyme